MAGKIEHADLIAEMHEVWGVSKECYDEFQDLCKSLSEVIERGEKNELFKKVFIDSWNVEGARASIRQILS